MLITTENSRRIQYKCRRGMLELDFLLQRFFDSQFASLTEIEKQTFDQLLDLPDAVLYDCFLGYAELDENKFSSLVTKIRSNFT